MHIRLSFCFRCKWSWNTNVLGKNTNYARYFAITFSISEVFCNESPKDISVKYLLLLAKYAFLKDTVLQKLISLANNDFTKLSNTFKQQHDCEIMSTSDKNQIIKLKHEMKRES